MFWDDFEFRISLEQSWMINIENEARWAIDNNLVEGEEVPNYRDYVYLNALDEVKPEAVGIIQ